MLATNSLEITEIDIEGLMTYEAPYLLEKLIKEQVASDQFEAQLLFREVKRYLLITRTHSNILWDMYSARVDEAWHHFVLFTAEYIAFSNRFFGKYAHHSPMNAPPIDGPTLQTSSFGDFSMAYETLFQEPLPDVWFNWKRVQVDTRVKRDLSLAFDIVDSADAVEICRPDGQVVFVVNRIASPAISFAFRCGAFHVRELPGLLTDQEKIDLVSVLVRQGFLRIAL